MSGKPGLIFKSKLHKKIYLHSSDWVFELGEREVEFLGVSPKKLTSIGGFFFQLIKSPDNRYLLFKLPEKLREQKRFYEFRDGDFYLRGQKAIVHPLSLLDFRDAEEKDYISPEERADALMFHEIFITRERNKRDWMMEDPIIPVEVETVNVGDGKFSSDEEGKVSELSESVGEEEVKEILEQPVSLESSQTPEEEEKTIAPEDLAKTLDSKEEEPVALTEEEILKAGDEEEKVTESSESVEEEKEVKEILEQPVSLESPEASETVEEEKTIAPEDLTETLDSKEEEQVAPVEEETLKVGDEEFSSDEKEKISVFPEPVEEEKELLEPSPEEDEIKEIFDRLDGPEPSEAPKMEGEEETIAPEDLAKTLDSKEDDLEEIAQSLQQESHESESSLDDVPPRGRDSSSVDVNVNVPDSLFETPVDLSRRSGLWFTLDRDFDSTDQFWEDLREYYKNNPIDLKAEIPKKGEMPPVFARMDTSINLPKFHEVFLAKISERVEHLSSKKMEIERDIKTLEDNLMEKGRIPDGDKNFQELLVSKKNLSECLERAKKALEEYEENSKNLESEAKRIIGDRFYLDIHGQPAIVSKYHEFITLKLMDLNQELNFLHRRHMELEHLLIKRLKEVEKAKETRSKIIKLEQEELMEAYRDDIHEYFSKEVDARRRREFREMMGEIHENTAEIQKHIEDEKRKIKYYMDNLQDLSRYEKYDSSLFQYKKRKQRFRTQTDEFNRYVYKLKQLVEEREKTRRDFFEGTRRDILDFQREISTAYADTDILARNSLASLWDQWEQEAKPCINILSTRSSQIIDAFSFVPVTQIKRVHRFKSRLREEAIRRQTEWERIFNEVKQEFRKLGYETMYPLPSELDGKYIKKLEEASLKLSDATKNILFIPTSKFSLAPMKDVTLGLDPKLLDDDRFVVIDQVWTTLTPEQEEKLQETLKMESQKKKFESSVNSMNFLKREQMKDLKDRYKPQKTTMKIFSKPITKGEKYEKMKTIEEAELKMMKDDHYLFSNTIGEFKDLLFSISKKLFQTKSVRMVKRDIKLTDDGKVNDGGTQIFSEYDYFIKSPDLKIFRDIAEDVDLSQDDSVYDEPNEEVLEYIANPEHVERIYGKQEKDESSLPSIGDLARLTAGKMKTLKEKRLFDLGLLKEKMMEVDEEVEKLKDYHENQTKTLELVLSDREELFREMQNSKEEMSKFLSEKELELDALMERIEKELDISLQEINESLFRKPKRKELKRNLTRWYVRLMRGENDRSKSRK